MTITTRRNVAPHDVTTSTNPSPRKAVLTRKVLTIMGNVFVVVACWVAVQLAAKQFMGADLHNPVTFVGLSLLGVVLGVALARTTTDS
jgi:hypothetical protein